MSMRAPGWLSVAVAVSLLLLMPAPAGGWGDNDQTEDVLYMVDGRELHGHILSETSTEVVFQMINPRLGLKTRLTLKREDIAGLERGVAPEGKADEDAPAAARGAAAGAAGFGQPQPAVANTALPSIYVVPMKGQMGTDIHGSIYEDVIEDIREKQPDAVIFELDSKDYPDLMLPQVEDPRETRGMFMIEEFRDLVTMLKQELAGIRQVMWVRDSVGFSSLLALSWEELYMAPDARLSGLRNVIDSSGADQHSDEDVRAKMSAAYTAFVKVFLEYGGYGAELADAMLWPESTLSASFKGRDVIWSPNMNGEFIVDADEKSTVAFRAKTAEDLLISDGTVESVDDLAFLLGYREYRLVGDRGQDLVTKYVDQWRKVFEQTKQWYEDYDKHRDWASGKETVKWLGRAKQDLERVVAAMSRYAAVEARWNADLGVSKLQLEIEVEKLQEEIRGQKQRTKSAGGSRNRPGGRGAPGG